MLCAVLLLTVLGGVLAETPAKTLDLDALIGVDGTPIATPAGGVTELIFTARWCRPCEDELADARRRLGQLRRSGYRVVVVGIPLRQDQAGFVKWAAANGVRRGLVFDAEGRLSRRFGAERIPFHVVIGPSRRVLYSGFEAPDMVQLRQWLQK